MSTVVAGARRLRAACILFGAAAFVAGGQTDPTYRALRAARPDGKAVAVRDLTLERDVFRFRFGTGTFQFLTSVEGRPFGAVFSGDGTLELQPASEGERRYLAFVTGEKALRSYSESFSSLLLFFSDDTAAQIEKGATAGTPLPGAADLYQSSFKKQRRDWKSNLQIRLLADAWSPGASGGVFLAVVNGKKSSNLLVAVDPRGLEWLFSGVGNESSALAVMRDRDPSLWYCARAKLVSPAGKQEVPDGAARASHYTVETTIRKNGEIDATTTILLQSSGDALRVLPLHLMEKLRVREASFAPAEEDVWTPLAVIQEPEKEDSDAAVVFPSALVRGRPVRVRLVYGGKDVLRNAGDGNFFVGARDSWYPNLGTFTALASFDLSYRCPKGFEVVSVGTREEDRIEEDSRVFRFRQTRPIRVAGFNYGKFRKLERTDPDSGFTVSVYTNTGTPDFIQELNLLMQGNRTGLNHVPVDTAGFADAAMVDGINGARAGSVFFGPLPEKRVAITQQTQAFFGQSWPSLIYMPFLAALDSTVRRELGLTGASHFVDEVGPHEFAHQWWGHLVGWNNYRDQWLSEGFAEFSVSLVLQSVDGGKKFNPFWERARRAILETPRGSSVSNDSVGPISLGWRLGTPRSPEAYQAMVYSKGAYVLHMLRMSMKQYGTPNPDSKFIEMLKDFVSTWSDKNPSTADFQAVVERHMVPALNLANDGKLDWFFRQWVDGTEIPRYRSKLAAVKAGDQYRIQGTISQDGVSDDFRSLAHVYVEFPKGDIRHLGAVPLTGRQTLPVDVTIKLPVEPKRILVNAMHDVLTRD